MTSGYDISNGLDVSPDEALICEEEGCDRPGVECYLPDTPLEARPDYIYCPEHTHKNGFCWLCGGFWGGVESFDFKWAGSDLCENCEAAEVAEYDVDGEDYEYDGEARP